MDENEGEILAQEYCDDVIVNEVIRWTDKEIIDKILSSKRKNCYRKQFRINYIDMCKKIKHYGYSCKGKQRHYLDKAYLNVEHDIDISEV